MKKMVLAFIPALLCGLVLTGCGSERVEPSEPSESMKFGLPSAFINTISKKAACIFYDENNRFSKITFDHVTFTFEYDDDRIKSCNMAQMPEKHMDYLLSLQKIEFIYETKNRVIANMISIDNTVFRDTIYISDNGMAENINNTFYTYEPVTGNLKRIEDVFNRRKRYREFEFDVNPGLYNHINIDSWLCHYFNFREVFIYSYPVFKLLLNHTNNVVLEKIGFVDDPMLSVIGGFVTYTYGENNYPNTVQIGDSNHSHYEIKY
jgi:hypothetical protein